MDDKARPSLAEEIEIPTGGSQDPFASAVRTTRMPMVITDPRQPDNPIVFCNDAFTQLSGYAREEILGRNCRFLQGPATRDADVERIRRAIEAREAVGVDILNYRKDGTTFWNALLMSPVFANNELVYFFASQMDVTERKRDEEHRYLLDRELQHRVKNTLATVQTIVSQTLRTAEVPPEVADAVTGRLQALARSHDVMTREAWASARLGDVIRAALEPLHGVEEKRFQIDGPDVRITPRIATMLSLAVHELGENATRYGSLSTDTGSVSIHWWVEGKTFGLEWRETGGGAIHAPASAGYGMKILRRVLPLEFDGTAEVDFAESGLRYSLRAPVDGLGVDHSQWEVRAS